MRSICPRMPLARSRRWCWSVKPARGHFQPRAEGGESLQPFKDFPQETAQGGDGGRSFRRDQNLRNSAENAFCYSSGWQNQCELHNPLAVATLAAIESALTNAASVRGRLKIIIPTSKGPIEVFLRRWHATTTAFTQGYQACWETRLGQHGGFAPAAWDFPA